MYNVYMSICPVDTTFKSLINHLCIQWPSIFNVTLWDLDITNSSPNLNFSSHRFIQERQRQA